MASKEIKKKVFVLTVSKQFPMTHSRKGESTGFVENISKWTIGQSKKIHTIRANYPLWENRIKQINEGKAVLSIRYWSGMPYKSKMVEILQLEKVGIEKLRNPRNLLFSEIGEKQFDWDLIAKNDGLSFIDFCEWFKNVTDEPMAIIHFCPDFRYGFDNSTGYFDDLNNPIFIGDKLRSEDGYEVIVQTGSVLHGRLVCDENHPCKDIPYNLNKGKGYVKINSTING